MKDLNASNEGRECIYSFSMIITMTISIIEKEIYLDRDPGPNLDHDQDQETVISLLCTD